MEPVEINAGTYYLRALRADDRLDDRPAVVEAFADPLTRRWLPEYRVDNLDMAGTYIAALAEQWTAQTRCSWAVADPLSGALLGEVGLKQLDLAGGTAQVSCWTRPAARSSGVAGTGLAAALRFGFGALGLRRVEFRHAQGNAASAAVAARCGFRCLGTVPEVLVRLGDGTQDHVRVWVRTPDG